MSKKDEALKLALETSEGIVNADWRKWDELASPSEFERWAKSRANFMATILREALAEQPAQQEPVALEDVYLTIIQWDVGGGKRSRRELARRIVAKYTPPPQRKPLTDEEIEDIWADCPADWDDKINVLTLSRAIEAAHGIKENT